MPREVDGMSDAIDELVDWQLSESPAARRQIVQPVSAAAGIALPHTTRETVEES